jgi:hypothetical protein
VVFYSVIGGMVLGHRQIFQAYNIEHYHTAPNGDAQELYAMRAGFQNARHLVAALPVNTLKMKAVECVGLCGVPAAAVIFLVSRELWSGMAGQDFDASTQDVQNE